MIQFSLNIAFPVLTIAILLGLFRMARGPTVLDRVVAFDLIAVCSVGMIVLLSIQWSTALYLELILIFSLLGFLTTVAFVLYLHKKVEARHQDAETPPSESSSSDPKS
jgi:multisubunit Na+/H+ antiporter MnhF subunit